MSETPSTDPTHVAYERGRRMGLATGALALSVVAYVNLLGMEKSILAGVLAWLALRGAQPVRGILLRGRAALAIAALHVLTVATLVIVLHDRLLQLIHLLEKLG